MGGIHDVYILLALFTINGIFYLPNGVISAGMIGPECPEAVWLQAQLLLEGNTAGPYKSNNNYNVKN
jgi:hypothetical protein